MSPARIEQLRLSAVPLVFSDAQGAWLRTASGGRYLDLSAGYGTAVLGHRHPTVMEALAAHVGPSGPTFTYATGISPLAGGVAARLCRLARYGLTKTYFGNSGAEGIEAALKFAMLATGRSAFVGFYGGYHGMTLGALGVTSVPHLTARLPSKGLTGYTAAIGDLDQVEAHLRRDEVAAVVVEVVQSMAGARRWTADGLTGLAALCDRYGALLVVDEVLTGLARTGAWFAFHDAGMHPDIVVVSKALTGGAVPVCAVLMTDSVYGAVFAGQPGVHTSTFEASLLAMAAADSVMTMLEQPGVREHADRVGRRLHAGLEHVRHAGASSLAQVRAAGLLLGVRISDAYQRGQRVWGAPAFREELASRGVLCQLAAADPSVLLLTPPLTISETEVDIAVAAFEDAAASSR